MLTRPRPADQGFTLIEMSISLVVLGMLIAAIAGALSAALRAERDTDTQLGESGDVQAATSYLADDVAGAQSFATSGAPRCGADPALVVEFRGQSFDPATLIATTSVISYVMRTVTIDGLATRQLHRLVCSTTSASPSYPLIPQSDGTIARRLSATVDPVVSCATAAGSPVVCSDASAGRLSIGLTGRSGSQSATLTARRRTA